jgi:hypothetical protein
MTVCCVSGCKSRSSKRKRKKKKKCFKSLEKDESNCNETSESLTKNDSATIIKTSESLSRDESKCNDTITFHR